MNAHSDTDTRPVPVEVLDELGAYRRVYVIEHQYHRNWGNLTKTDPRSTSKPKRQLVIGVQMRCGQRIIHNGLNWNRLAVHATDAHQHTDPCHACFPTLQHPTEPSTSAEHDTSPPAKHDTAPGRERPAQLSLF